VSIAIVDFKPTTYHFRDRREHQLNVIILNNCITTHNAPYKVFCEMLKIIWDASFFWTTAVGILWHENTQAWAKFERLSSFL